METLRSLSLSEHMSTLILLTFSGISGLIARQSKEIVGEGSFVKKEVDKSGPPARIFIPDVFARWPWPRRVNPNYTSVKEEADAWVNSFKAFSPKAQEAYNRCDFNLLACLAYPTASKEHVRAACDLLHVLFLVDEYCETSAPSEVREQKNVFMDALRNPHTPRPKGEWIGGEVIRQFWERTIQNATETSRKRFIQAMDECLEEAIRESINKEDQHILDVKSYIAARRRTAAVQPAFALIELGLDIPDEVMAHPSIQEMFLAAVDLVAFSNDVFSYNLEQHRGDDLSNMITCVMNEFHTDVNGAMLWVENFLLKTGERFQTALAALPQWEEPLNSQVKAYCDGLGQWVRANNDWSFESERYFGNKGRELRENRWMSLLPRKRPTEIGPVRVDSSLL